eukprot:gene23152-28136_t
MNPIKFIAIALGVALLVLQSEAFSRFSNPKKPSFLISKVPAKFRESKALSAMLPGDPLVVGTLTQGTINVISIYNNILIASVALSWFPQIYQTVKVLRILPRLSEPYLRIFRGVIPPIAGFDLSPLAAFFLLDILSQTTAAVGAEIPPGL